MIVNSYQYTSLKWHGEWGEWINDFCGKYISTTSTYTSEIRLNHISTAFFMLYEINNNKKIKIYYILTLTLNLYVSTSPTRQPTIRCLGYKPQRQLGQAGLMFSVMYFKSTLRAPFTSLSMVAPQDGHRNVFEEPKFLFITPQHPQVLLVYSSVQMTTLHQGYSRDLWSKYWRKR